MDPLSRLAPFIREYIYREKWTGLRDIQEAAIGEIFDSPGHVLIAAGTASGKTEAAFFPLLSVLEKTPQALVLYVSPLKALINDQAKRLEKILRSGRDTGETGIRIWRWHGDISANYKERFLEDPAGVLQITPESLEALLLRRPREVPRVFKNLIFTVIDEVHSFMGSDRGSQLICQLARISNAVRGGGEAPEVRRLGLSATLGDYEGARRWLAQGTGLPAALLSSGSGGRRIRIALDYVENREKNGAAFYRSLYEQCREKRSIIFTNSRLEAEECAASLSALARTLGEEDIFYVHHGSVSALLRNEAEEKLKLGEGPQAACATATLELGIDTGDLDRIIQLGPPWSVSAFVQRLGRSGRRTGGGEIYFSIGRERENPFPVREEEAPDYSRALEALPWELLRTMAVIQLYLEEKWIEPPEEKPLPYSLLFHQTLSILASLGEHSPEGLVRRVLGLPPFAAIPREDFRLLLTWLLDCGFVQKTGEGTFILGLEGERLVHRHSFYSVFPGEETFRVMLEGREIGTVNFVPDPLSVLAVGGKRWMVKSIDGRRREIWVEESPDAGNERLWKGRGGAVHRRILQTMRRILAEPSSSPYPYLSPAAAEALEQGRRTARNLDLADNVLIGGGEETKEDIETRGTGAEAKQVFLLPWTGTAGMKTLEGFLKKSETKKALKILSIKQTNGFYFGIDTKHSLPGFRSALLNACKMEGESPEMGFSPRDIPFTGKYDYLLPPELLAKQYAANILDKTAAGELALLL